MSSRKLEGLPRREILLTGNRLVFSIGLAEKLTAIYIACFSLYVFWQSMTHPLRSPLDVPIRIVDLISGAYVLYYTFSFQMMVGDGFITKRVLGKYHSIRMDDVQAWHVRYSFKPLGRYTIESKSGTTFGFPANIDRPRELEQILDLLMGHDFDAEE